MKRLTGIIFLILGLAVGWAGYRLGRASAEDARRYQSWVGAQATITGGSVRSGRYGSETTANLEFADAAGKRRFLTDTVPGTYAAGDTLSVVYDPHSDDALASANLPAPGSGARGMGVRRAGGVPAGGGSGLPATVGDRWPLPE